MKKILTVLIAVLLLFASVSLNVCAAEPLTPVEFYPGVGTITLKYETAITDASQIGSIVLKEEDGAEISLSHYYNNNIVTLKTPNPLEIDGQTYGLTINGEKYNFTLETVWEMEIDDEGNVANVKSKVPSDKTAVLTSVRKGEVVEENAAIINGAYASFSPDYDQTQHKNLSMVFDYAHINSWNVHLGIRFNASVQTGTYRRYVNGISYSAAFWETSSQTLARTNARGIAIYDPSYPDNKTISGLSPDASTLREAKYQAGSGITYANFRNLKAGSYSETYGYTPDNSLLTGTAIKGSSTINTPNGVTDDLKSFSFAVDKMGATGTLLMENMLIDVWNTEEDYALYNEAKNPDLTAPETGYMELDSDLSAMVIKNWRLVQSKVRQYKKGDLTIESSQLTGDNSKFDIIFSDDIEPAKNVKDYIKLYAQGEPVDYTYETDGNKMSVVPAGGLVADITYTVQILTGFGYEELTVKQDAEAEYMFVSRVGDIVVESIKGGDKEIYVRFNYDISEIPLADIKSNVELALNGNDIPYTLKIDGDTIILNIGESITRDVIYDLNIKAGLGFEKVTVKEDINKYLIMETVIDEKFDGGVSSDYISTSRNGDATESDKIPETTIRNGKLYVEDSDYFTIYFNKLGIEEHEDYVMKFDVEHYGKEPADYFMINVDKAASGIMNYGGALNGFGWNVNGTSWQRRMQWGPAKGLKVYNTSTDPNGGVGGFNSELFVINGTDSEVTLPESAPVVTSYTIEKQGKIAKLFVGGNEIDTLDCDKMLADWNKENSTTPITDTIPSKGVLVYSACRTASGGRGITAGVAFEGIEVSVLREYTEGGLKVVENGEGKTTIKNFNESPEYVKLYVAEYEENNKMNGAKVVADAVLAPGESVTQDHGFDSEKTKLVQIDEKSIEDFKGIKITEIKKKDFENNIITIKGNVEAKKYDREIPVFLVKENTDLKTSATLNEGLIAIIPTPAEETEFEYDFEYNDVVNKLYTLEAYCLKGINSVAEFEKCAQYRYAEKNEVLAYIETLKTTKSTITQLKDYAQSLGSDISFMDGISAQAQDIVLESIYADRGLISTPESAMKAISTAKARLVLIQELKNNVVNAVDVDTALTKYAAESGLDLSAYNRLGSNKTTVCNGFIRADYEAKGWNAFKTAFAEAVKNAGGTSAGGGTGGGGGGGGGGASFVPTVTVTGGKEMTDDKKADTTIKEVESFADMSEHLWAEEAVYALKEKGVISGIGGNLFNPDGAVTREQFAKMAVIAFGMYSGDAKSDFADVNEGDWSYTYISSAKNNGLMLGDADNNFMVNKPITREDLCVILYRASVKNGKTYTEKKNNFADMNTVSDYAVEAVEYMAGAGIINGFEDNTFKAKEPATRAQAALLIYLVMGGNR